MASINNNITVDLPFEDDLKDKCENTWTITGSPIIKDCSHIVDINGEKLFDKAAYFNGSSALQNDSFLFGNDDFTIQFWMSADNVSDAWVFRIDYQNDSGDPFLRIAISGNKFYISTKGYGAKYLTNITPKVNTWYNISLCYKHLERKVYFYINGELVDTPTAYYDSKQKYIFRIGRSSSYHYGFIKHVRFYDDTALYTETKFDITETYKPIDYNPHFNTKRLFSFTYYYNTIRKTKWNQKANMYVMGPSSFIKK